MTVIRGATTVAEDSKADILESVKELLDEIFEANALNKEEIKVIIFSLTSDIHAYHPAKAARECGYDFAEYFRNIGKENASKPEKKKTEYSFKAMKKYEDWPTFAKETVWYGRRKGATLYPFK